MTAEMRREIVRDAVGIGVATGAYGLSFGALSVAAGLDVAQTSALSLLMFTGASQFALIGVLGAGGAEALLVRITRGAARTGEWRKGGIGHPTYSRRSALNIGRKAG